MGDQFLGQVYPVDSKVFSRRRKTRAHLVSSQRENEARIGKKNWLAEISCTVHAYSIRSSTICGMCAHYEAVSKPERLLSAFKVNMPQGAKVDVWPGFTGLFIRRPKEAIHAEGVAPWREAMPGSFGLIPHWAKDVSLAKRTYNARSETVATKPSYRDAWRLGRRCIIPAEAFYEPDWRSGRAVPTRIARSDGKPMGIAGIWTGWRAPDGTIIRSMSMLTVNADDHPLMRNFHRPEDEKRMVVILDDADYDAWLNESNDSASRLLVQFATGRLAAMS